MTDARRTHVALVLGALLGSIARPARAQSNTPSPASAPPQETSGERSVHVVIIAASDRDRSALEIVVRELLARLQIEVSLTATAALDLRSVVEPPRDARSLARVWIDCTRSQSVGIYLTDSTGGRVLIVNSSLATPGVITEVTREEVAHIVRDAVAALRAGYQIGLTNAQARAQLGVAESTPTPPPPEPRVERRRVFSPARTPMRSRGDVVAASIGLGYATEALWGAAVVAHGPTVQVALPFAWRPRWTFAANFLGQYRFAEARSAPIGVTLDQLVARALVSVDYGAAASPWSIGAAVGAGFDAVLVTAQRGSAPTAELEPARWQHLPRVRAQTNVSAALHPLVVLSLGVYVDVDVLHVDYVFDRDREQVTVVAPSIARPGLTLSLSITTRRRWP